MNEKKKIAIQGVKAAFHDIVAHKYFGDDIIINECETFKALCESLKNGDSDAAVMAIENTLAGTLLPNYSLLQEYGFHVVGELNLHIQMCLMALPGVKIEDLKYVQSHPIALQQCAKFINAHPSLKALTVDDTAGSAKAVQEGKLTDTAAIASEQAAEAYGLNLLQKNVETNKLNFTRFLMLSRGADLKPVVGANKSSLYFELRHKVGSLAKVLTIFNDNGINLNKIQSIPIIGKPFEFTFIVDLLWEDENNYRYTVDKLQDIVINLHILGEYIHADFQLDE
ncbi:MAG: ACT domain-containing protein [Flavobacteriales bacterium]|nr:ACT domain-containing protein [Flavobacteriales bacterium]